MTTVALIDDEPNILKALRRTLGREGWTILTFDKPENALKELSSTHVDLVISDYMMPHMNGVEFLELFKKQHTESLAIILSGQADLTGIMNAINTVGIYRFILKPWQDDDLRLTIKNALAHSQLEQENKILLRTLEHQRKELIRLESESPGITQIDLNEDGCIDLSKEFDEN